MRQYSIHKLLTAVAFALPLASAHLAAYTDGMFCPEASLVFSCLSIMACSVLETNSWIELLQGTLNKLHRW